MSLEDAQEFYSMMGSNDDFRAEVMDASDNVLQVAAAHGLEFSRDELVQVLVSKFDDIASNPGDLRILSSIASERPAQ